MTMRDESEYNYGRGRVQQTADWMETHEQHGAISRLVEEPQPPSHTIATLVCECGARHYVLEQKATV